ncbi:MarR family transcriptional regulator, partial [Escherichia coli]|nr:MarR family transcriptional regulator [Escherichia coli]
WLMMSLWDALRMNMMISYQELVRTFPNITRITDFLEKAGYVKRTDSREDRRAKKISLTSEGMFFIQRLT